MQFDMVDINSATAALKGKFGAWHNAHVTCIFSYWSNAYAFAAIAGAR